MQQHLKKNKKKNFFRYKKITRMQIIKEMKLFKLI